ncbi:MAG: LemA family protein [Nocardioidaceae bacterium]
MIWLVILIIALLLVAAFVWSTYNALIRARTSAEASWSDITVALKRRADLIPNLVETVKGYAAHEREVFENVTAARSRMLGAIEQGPKATGEAEGPFQSALKSLFAVAEAYPDLRASENFQALQWQLSGTEDTIASSRSHYNGAVRVLNTKIQTFPANLFAHQLGFSEREYFEVSDLGAIQQPPTVQF